MPTPPAVVASPTSTDDLAPTPDPVFPTTPVATPTPGVKPSPTAGSPQAVGGAATSKTHYRLEVSFDYLAHRLSVNETVDFSNGSTEALANLMFDVEPNDHPGDITFTNITIENTPASGVVLAKNRLSFPLSTLLAPGQSSAVTLVYDLSLPAIPPPSDTIRPEVFGYTANQANLVDWFPYLAVYQVGKGWITHDPWYYGEHQVYPIADFDVALTLVSPPPGLVIAAPVASQDDGAVRHYTLANARTFAWSASPLYKTFTQKAGAVEVTSYAFPLDQRAGQAALDDTAAALSLYASLFGPYQHASLALVEGDFLDGMEYDGLFFLSKGFYNLYDGTPKGYLTAIAVHETAHQWFFAQVGNDQAMEPWLDEAFATYCEKLYYEHTYPDLVKWWWSFRVDFYNPSGAINQSIYDFKGFEPYRNAVYLHGAQFLDALRSQIGDDAFFNFLKDYVAQEQYHIATSQDFFTLLATHTKQDISPLKAKYFGPTGQ
jgi:hypothetical protein